jgi:hypothetical protein
MAGGATGAKTRRHRSVHMRCRAGVFISQGYLDAVKPFKIKIHEFDDDSG